MMESANTCKSEVDFHTTNFAPRLPESNNKKYRLRPINLGNENGIYKKYFQAKGAKWISWIQVIIGLVTFVTQIMRMTINQKINSTILLHTVGTWALANFAAAFTVSAASRATYCRLHAAMIFHIANTIVQYLVLEQVFHNEIPNIRKEVAEEVRADGYIEFEEIQIECRGINCTNYNWELLKQKDIDALTMFYRIQLSLIGMIAIYAVLQLLLSLLVVLMTGRAICCGRISMERRFYEISNVGSGFDRGMNRPGIMTLPEVYEVQEKMQQRKESDNSEVSMTSPCHSPPPYVSTPRNSTDVMESDTDLNLIPSASPNRT